MVMGMMGIKINKHQKWDFTNETKWRSQPVIHCHAPRHVDVDPIAFATHHQFYSLWPFTNYQSVTTPAIQLVNCFHCAPLPFIILYYGVWKTPAILAICTKYQLSYLRGHPISHHIPLTSPQTLYLVEPSQSTNKHFWVNYHISQFH